MTTRPYWLNFDPQLDLMLERVIDVPVDRVWQAWTMPQHIKKWFTPEPWKTVDCELDLRPGGLFRTVMQSPEGQQFPEVGCYLDIVPQQRLVWTSALRPGFRPVPLPVSTPGHECAELPMTAIILMEPQGRGTKYNAIVLHRDDADRRRHETMGFHAGWGKATDQLVEAVKAM
ncbi:MAG: SRPBCC family protein [Phycisphaeraceae bacterium]|nr:SRPBCC family protein [Phycisphaeraceae bacterium]